MTAVALSGRNTHGWTEPPIGSDSAANYGLYERAVVQELVSRLGLVLGHNLRYSNSPLLITARRKMLAKSVGIYNSPV